MPAGGMMTAGLMSIGGGLLSSIFGSKPTTTTGTYTPNEPAYWTQFRQSLIPQYQNFLAQAQKPVYGDAAKAMYMQQQNQNLTNAQKALAAGLAGRTGSVSSGAYGKGLTDLSMQRLGQLSNFNMQLPMLNQEAYMKNVGSALNMGMDWAGRAPVGYTQTGTQQGPGMGAQFAGAMGGMMGGLGGQMMGNYFNTGNAFTSPMSMFMNQMGGGGGPLNWGGGAYGATNEYTSPMGPSNPYGPLTNSPEMDAAFGYTG